MAGVIRVYFLRARSRDDLQRRMIGHRRIADFTYGLFGRSPDHVASFITGMAMKLDALNSPCGQSGQRAALLQARARQRSLRRLCRAAAAGRPRSRLLSPAQSPAPDLAGRARRGRRRRHFRHEDARDRRGVRQRDLDRQRYSARAGAEEGSDHLRHSCNAHGLRLWSRKPMEADCTSEFDSPLSFRYDESDSMLLCDEVKVPWERVFVHDDAVLSREIYIKTPEPLLRQSPIERALLVEDAAHGRPVRQDRQCDRRRSGAGGQGNARPHLRPGSDDRRHGQRPDQRLRELGRAGRKAMSASTGA